MDPSIDWIGLGWISLDWIGLGWISLWIGFGWIMTVAPF